MLFVEILGTTDILEDNIQYKLFSISSLIQILYSNMVSSNSQKQISLTFFPDIRGHNPKQKPRYFTLFRVIWPSNEILDDNIQYKHFRYLV